MKFEEVKKDYLKITGTYGDPYDMTGGFVIDEHYEKLMLNPSKRNGKNLMIEIINYGFLTESWQVTDHMGEMKLIPVEGDLFLEEMYEKYC